GIKIPSLKDLPKVSDQQLSAAWEDENGLPKKDVIRIAAIPKKVNVANMGNYIAAIQVKVFNQLSAEVKQSSEKIYNYIQSNSKNSGESGNMAAALWTAGKLE